MSSAEPPVLVFCLEELSAKTLLESLVPRLFPQTHFEIQFIVFKGKSDSDKKIERRLRGWLQPNSRFIVLRDRDNGDCHEIKRNLVFKCEATGHPEALVRIACSELESWYLGDLAAVELALGVPNLAKQQQTRKFREPDALGNPAQELGRLTDGVYQKVGGSRKVGKYLNLDPTANRSASFRVFIEGLRRITLSNIGDP